LTTSTSKTRETGEREREMLYLFQAYVIIGNASSGTQYNNITVTGHSEGWEAS